MQIISGGQIHGRRGAIGSNDPQIAVLPGVSFTFAAQESDPAHAISGDGHAYDVTCNANGFVLTSLHPVYRFIENGALSTIEEGIETIYLGKSCDAFTSTFGEGHWGWANGGYLASFDSFRIGFPRQEPFCPESSKASLDFAVSCPLP